MGVRKKPQTAALQPTSNPDWWKATTAAEILPESSYDASGASDRFLKLCGAYRLNQGYQAGKRLGEVMMPWQERFFRAIGHINPETGKRQIKEAFLLVGKGSSKSTMVQSITLALVLDSAASGKNYRMDLLLLATDLRTSKLLFEGLRAAILSDPFLEGQFRISLKDVLIEHRQSGITIRCLPCLLSSAVARRPFAVVFDELHLAAKGNQFNEFHDQVCKGMSNADEPLRIYATTAAIGSPAGVYSEKLAYFKRVQDGEIIDPTSYPALFRLPLEFDASIDFRDPANFHFGMPSLSHGNGTGTQTVEALVEEIEKAVRVGGSELELLMSQRFCIDEDLRGGSSECNVLKLWDRMPEPDVELLDRYDGAVALGLDVGGLQDLQSLTFCWRDTTKSPLYNLRTWQFLTESGYERQSVEGKTIIDQAVALGTCLIYPTPDQMDSAMAQWANTIISRCYNFPIICGDKFGRTGVVERLTEITGQQFVDVPQNWRLKGAWQQLQALPLDGLLCMEKCPLIKWNLQNVRVDLEALGKVFYKKDASSAGQCRIDGVMSMLSALKMVSESKLNTHNPGGNDGVVFVDIDRYIF